MRMDLVATPGNPMPPDPILSAVRTEDGVTLRVARWVTARDGRGTVFVAPGRSEFIESYFEIAAELLKRRFDVMIIDWRGQGQSDRETPSRGRGHVKSFADYQRDLAAFEIQILRPFGPKPWYGLGHSMGGAILLDQAHSGTSPFTRLVLSAPMIDLPLRMRKSIEFFIRLAALTGFGGHMIPGGDEASIFDRGYDNNPLTSDRRRYERTASILRHAPHLAIGAPTIAWVNAAFRLIARFRSPRYAIDTLTPILIVAAGADRIVDTAAAERFAARLKTGRCITIANSRHELIMERDAICDQFWAAFDAFIPGHQDIPGLVDRFGHSDLQAVGAV